MKIVMLGPQGSGKGTQAALIAKEFSLPHISTGDIFRENIKNQTELGKKVLEYTNKGLLVPDELVNEIIQDALNKHPEGFILDGYPRNIAQAKVLDGFEGIKIDHIIEIRISDEEAVRRISGRRTCEDCGFVTSYYAKDYDKENEKCSRCGGKMVIRDDDKEDAVKKRLEIYHNETEPIIEFYRDKDVLLSIEGERPIDDIFREIKKKISG